MSDVFTIKELESFTPGARPQDEDFENMITRLGTNVVVLHKNFMHDEMPWMVLVHIPTGKRIQIVFPEEHSILGEQELKDSLNALKDLGEVRVREVDYLMPEDVVVRPMEVERPKPYVKGGDDETR